MERDSETIKLELENLQAQIAGIYTAISKMYMRMSKVHDDFSYKIIETGIDEHLKQVTQLREKAVVVRKELINAWSYRGE